MGCGASSQGQVAAPVAPAPSARQPSGPRTTDVSCRPPQQKDDPGLLQVQVAAGSATSQSQQYQPQTEVSAGDPAAVGPTASTGAATASSEKVVPHRAADEGGAGEGDAAGVVTPADGTPESTAAVGPKPVTETPVAGPRPGSSPDAGSSGCGDRAASGGGEAAEGASSGFVREEGPPAGAVWLQLRHAMVVNGRLMDYAKVLEGSSFPVEEVSDVAELMQVWQEKWYCFPNWMIVEKTRQGLMKEGLWAGMSYPEKRMAAELTVNAPYHFPKCGPLLARCRALRSRQVGKELRQQGQQGAASAAPVGEEPKLPQPTFVTRELLIHFTKEHNLRQVNLPEVDAPRAPPRVYETVGPAHLSAPVGRAHNLTAGQVYERIVLPSIEAAGGLSYAEAFGMTLRKEASAATPTGLLVPYSLDTDFCEMVSALAAALNHKKVVNLRNPTYGKTPLWVEMFCGPGHQDTAAPDAPDSSPPFGTEGGGEAVAALRSPGLCLSGAPYCRHVALLTGDHWPWAPLQVPPAFRSAAVAQLTLQAVQRGLRLRVLASAYGAAHELYDGRMCGFDNIFPRITELQAALWALGAPESSSTTNTPPPPPSQADSGAEKAATAPPTPPGDFLRGEAGGDPRVAAELWGLYVQGLTSMVQKMAGLWAQSEDDVYYGWGMRQYKGTKVEDVPKIKKEVFPYPKGTATLRVERRLLLEAVLSPPGGLTEAPPAASSSKRLPAPASCCKVVVSALCDRQALPCPADMSQCEADELCAVWQDRWACMPDWATVVRTRAACGGGDPGGQWARMSVGQRRTACELVLLYGEAAATWRPSAEAEAEARTTSSRGSYVSVPFLDRFFEKHKIPVDGVAEDLVSFAGSDVWSPCAYTFPATTTWVCANIVRPATEAYGMCYADLFLSAEAQSALLPPGSKPLCQTAEEAPSKFFASHAWACPYRDFHEALVVELKLERSTKQYDNQYWIDIFLKNQWQPVVISDLRDNLIRSQRVALVVHPFPTPLATTRVWCLFELMTALQLDVEVRLFQSRTALMGFNHMMEGGIFSFNVNVSPRLEAEVERIDVSQSDATVPADKELIMGMIHQSIGVDEMNKQVRELFRRLFPHISNTLRELAIEEASKMPSCFAGDGVVRRVVGTAVGPLPWGFRAAEAVGRGAGTTVVSAPGVAAGGPVKRGGAKGRSRRGWEVAPGQQRRQRQQPGAHSTPGPASQLCRVSDLRAGDLVLTADGGVSAVKLVSQDPVGPYGMELCALPYGCGGDTCRTVTNQASEGSEGAACTLLVTPDHPVRVGGVWRLPRDLAPVRVLGADRVPLGAVFNVELDPPAPLEVSGVVLVTLGQDSSREVRVGVDPASDALYGWGWRRNPDRVGFLRDQLARLVREGAAGRGAGGGARVEPAARWLAEAEGEVEGPRGGCEAGSERPCQRSG